MDLSNDKRKMKTTKHKLLIFVILALGLWLLAINVMHSQDRVTIGVMQDLRLATVGDGENYHPFTLDIILRGKLESHQKKHGYLIIVPEIEYANIKYGYLRYSIGVGWAYNDWWNEKIQTSAYLTYGFITRDGMGTQSWGLNSDISYDIGRFSIVVLGQLQERSDLRLMYGKGKIIFSGFVGLEIKL